MSLYMYGTGAVLCNGCEGMCVFFVLCTDKENMIHDSGKMSVLDKLLINLKCEGHRVLIYSQMTRMIDLLEEFMAYRRYKYIRLDGSSRISDRRDMVADFQTKLVARNKTMCVSVVTIYVVLENGASLASVCVLLHDYISKLQPGIRTLCVMARICMYTV